MNQEYKQTALTRLADDIKLTKSYSVYQHNNVKAYLPTELLVETSMPITTITMTCKINYNVDHEKIAKFPLYKNDILMIRSKTDDLFLPTKEILAYRKKKKIDTKQSFYNQTSLLMLIDGKLIHVKIFQSKSLQMTGLKSIQQFIMTIQKLSIYLIGCDALIDYNRTIGLEFTKVNSHMINVVHFIGYKISRTRLYNLIKKNNYKNVNVTYNPELFAGVKILIQFFESSKSKQIDIDKPCNSHIFVFESGKIVLSCKNYTLIQWAFKFITQYINENIETVEKIVLL